MRYAEAAPMRFPFCVPKAEQAARRIYQTRCPSKRRTRGRATSVHQHRQRAPCTAACHGQWHYGIANLCLLPLALDLSARLPVCRAGRTARAGRAGRVYTLLRDQDMRHFKVNNHGRMICVDCAADCIDGAMFHSAPPVERKLSFSTQHEFQHVSFDSYRRATLLAHEA
jgi:hypothetical protein